MKNVANNGKRDEKLSKKSTDVKREETRKIRKQPDFSVIMPTYNCLQYLPAAVDSVLRQRVNLELLIVDDRSDDGSDVWLSDLARRDPRVKLLKGHHKGVSAARNLALTAAQGRWVAFLDADDCWYADKLEVQLKVHQQNPNLILSFTDYDHFSEQDEYLGRCFSFWPRFSRLLNQDVSNLLLEQGLKTAIYEENVIGTSTVVVNRKALQAANGFDENLHSASDWDLWLRLLAHGDFMAINQPLMGYLVRKNSISRNIDRRLACFETILKRYKTPMQHLNPHCYAPAAARLQLAKAESWQVKEGGYWKAVQAYSYACYQLPTKRNLKALAAHLVKGGLRTHSHKSE
jgi:glycosyltransferase involved in cell wall biosynthesis